MAPLCAFGFDMSKRRGVRLLIAGQDGFVTEARDVLRAGLETARWVSVDDIGARHRGANSVRTQIGKQDFTRLGTVQSKSRLHVLTLLSAAQGDNVLNDAALDPMRDRGLAGPLIARLADSAERHCTSPVAWAVHLERLGSGGSLAPTRALPLLWGGVAAQGLLRAAVIFSDDAGQFGVGSDALCSVHAEHPEHRLDTVSDQKRAAQPDLALLRRSQDPSRRRLAPAAKRGARACRSHLPTTDRVRHD